jgi:Ankyrin repeats (3 copies)
VPTHSEESRRSLPENPNLQHLKNQAKDLLRGGEVASLSEAQFKIARSYGFASWPKLKEYIESLEEIGQLKKAIDANDVQRIKTMMTRNPALHRAPLGYGNNGPLTWVAECRVPWEPPGRERLAIAEWMIENGSDVHQGGDGPLMRAALNGYRIPMMELLVRHGADVNALWGGYFPIIFAPCESVQPEALKWLLEHGADPNCPTQRPKYPGTALDYVIGTYARSKQLGACMDLLMEARCRTKYSVTAVLDLLRGRLDLLGKDLDADPGLLSRQISGLDFGSTGAQRLTLCGATLLHVAAEYGNFDAAKLLLDRGADVNARSAVDESGVGGQTPIFHAVTQYGDWGFAVAQLLVERGADLSVRVKLPGHYERPEEFVECTPLGYARLFPGREDHSGGQAWPAESKSVKLLRERGAAE